MGISLTGPQGETGAAQCADLIPQSEGIERGEPIPEEGQPCPDSTNLRRALVDGDVGAGALQADRGGESADAGADHRDLHDQPPCRSAGAGERVPGVSVIGAPSGMCWWAVAGHYICSTPC